MRTMKGEMDMQNIYRVETRPIALSENVVKGEKYRITMLTEGLIRMEYSEHGVFEDRATQIVKERIEGGANEKAVWRLFINCPFVCINFDFFWLNKARQLYMDF